MLIYLILAAASALAAPPSGADARVEVDLSAPVATTDPRFLSVALDAAEVFGGRWWSGDRPSGARGAVEAAPIDLSRPELGLAAAALAPAVLRVGGTEADFLEYSETGGKLDGRRWDALSDFARGAGLDLAFTLNASPGSRDRHGDWDPANALALFAHARARGDRVAAWELGNEVSAYWATMGARAVLGPKRYARDYARLRAALDASGTPGLAAGPASAFWPEIGEPFPFFSGAPRGFLRDFLRDSSVPVELVTWHFYPTESRRCPVAVRRASAKNLLSRASLDEAGRISARISAWRAESQPHAALWLGETGSAQCGGEPGVSDRFASALAWLDELGSVARAGTALVVRQDLAGSDYGMLDPATFAPRPDFFASLAWKRLMGVRVLKARAGGDVRAYAHCLASGPSGSVALLLVNPTDRTARASLELPGPLESYALESRGGALGSDVTLNGETLSGLAPELRPSPFAGEIPPFSATFLVARDAHAAACR